MSSPLLAATDLCDIHSFYSLIQFYSLIYVFTRIPDSTSSVNRLAYESTMSLFWLSVPPYLTLPYLTFEVNAARGSIQRSGH